MTIPVATFTATEEAELTPLSCAAYDLMRVESQKTNTIPPCWLTCSAEVRQEYRRKALDWVRGRIGLHFDDAKVEQIVAQTIPPKTMNLWRQAEGHYKYLRETENNPRAFFAG